MTDDERPWEQRGGVRRDCTPHRGNWLMLLANVALACGWLSFVLFLPSVAAVVCAGAVRQMALYDLERMQSGLLDPRGRSEAESAMDRAALAVGVGAVGPLACFLLLILSAFVIYLLS